MKTAYVISPGLQMPGESFQWRGPLPIFSQPALWETMRTLTSGLVFRVRTDSNVGDMLGPADRIESCVGMIDSTSRWRACLELIRTPLTAMRIAEVAEPAWAVLGLITSKHPATIVMQERQQLAQALRAGMDKLPEGDPRAAFEASVAAMCIRLAFAENDVEVASIVPYSTTYMINAGEWHDDREATVEVLAGSVFLTYAHARLAEKGGEWLFSALPAPPGAVAPPAVPAKASQEALEDEES